MNKEILKQKILAAVFLQAKQKADLLKVLDVLNSEECADLERILNIDTQGIKKIISQNISDVKFLKVLNKFFAKFSKQENQWREIESQKAENYENILTEFN